MFWNVSEIWGLADGCEQRTVREAFHEYCIWKLKLACCFWPLLPCHWVPGREPENSVIAPDLRRTASVTLTPIYQMRISMRLYSEFTICTKKLYKRTFTLFDFITSAYQLLALLRRNHLRNSQRRNYAQPFLIKNLKSRKRDTFCTSSMFSSFLCLSLVISSIWMEPLPPQLQPPIKVLTPDALHTSMQ